MLLKRLAILAASVGAAGITGLLLCGEMLTLQVQGSPQQKIFLAGRVPSPAPKGFYAGSVPGMKNSSWQGKRFDPGTASEINIFAAQGKTSARYPFHTSTGAGVRDPQIRVLRINYNYPQNPW